MRRLGQPIATAVALALFACTQTSSPPEEQPPPGLPAAEGPLAGLTWPGELPPVGALVHDDGTTLWAVGPDGDHTALWEHPEMVVYGLAVGPSGEIAISGTHSHAARHNHLYLLRPDGEVLTIDTIPHQPILSPQFMTHPAERERGSTLFWVRSGERVSRETGRLESEVMFYDEAEGRTRGVRPVLRHHEGIWTVDAYPGHDEFLVTLFRQDNSPTRLEVLQSSDGATRQSAIDRWVYFEHRANTDIPHPMTWTTPIDYVIASFKDSHRDSFHLLRFRFECDIDGAQVLYRGSEVDVGDLHRWNMVPAHWTGKPDAVLVLTAADMDRHDQDGDHPVMWHVADGSGRLTPTPIRWRPGGWAWRAPPPVDDGERDCSGVDWVPWF